MFPGIDAIQERERRELHEKITQSPAAFEVCGIWVPTDKKRNPDGVGGKINEQIPCLIVCDGEILIRQWNCHYECWDTEDGDDFYCSPAKVTHWMPLPKMP